MTLSTCQREPQKVAQSIDVDVDFRAESTATAAQQLFGLTAFLLGCCPSGAGMSTNDGAIEKQMFHVCSYVDKMSVA